MTVEKYFILSDDIGTSKKFGVLMNMYEPSLEKIQNIQTTLEGGLDSSMGGIYEAHIYTLRIRETEDRADYGDKADLEYFFRLNNPNGTPSNRLILTDHFGIEHHAYYIGNLVPQYAGIMIEGLNAWMLIKCVFKFIPNETIGS